MGKSDLQIINHEMFETCLAVDIHKCHAFVFATITKIKQYNMLHEQVLGFYRTPPVKFINIYEKLDQ